ncbi:MAG: hypothetical protein STSR0008_05860 [Ignavibacterium sp.]
MKKNLNIIFISILIALIIWVSITLSEEYYYTYNVPLVITKMPQELALGAHIPSSVNIKVKGQGWRLLSLSLSSDFVFKTSINNNIGNVRIRLLNSLNENSWATSNIQIIDVNPSQIEVEIDKKISKKLPVKLNIETNFREGYGLAQLTILEPDSVVVFGSYKLISQYDSIPTKKYTFDNLDKEFEKTIELKEIQGLSFSSNKINVKFDIQQIVEKEFNDIPIEVKDVPPDRNVLLIPDKITVSLRGGINLLGKIQEEEINVFTDYATILNDTTGSIQPNVIVPQNTEFIYQKPVRIRYILKKF